MNGNNSWGVSPFVKFPKHDLGPITQRQPLPSRELVSMGQLMEGGGDPFQEGMPAPAMMPQQQMPRQQDYGEGRAPQGKKILGMPKDRFIALMGTIAQAFGGDSPSGRMGAGLINMADIMHQERMGQAETQAAEAKAKREAAAGTAKERRAAAAKKKEKAPTIRTFRVGDMDVQHSFDYETREWKPIPGMKGKPAIKEEKKKAPTIRTFRVGDKDVQHAWDTDTGKWKPIPGMPGKKIKPVTGEKAITPAEKRAQRKELRDLHATILGAQVDKKTGKSVPNIEYPEVQISIDSWNKLSNKPFVYQLIPGTPKQAIDWGRDIPAIPAKLEEVDITTSEKVKASNLSRELKVHLLKTRFGYE
jgi:hypothetical protein